MKRVNNLYHGLFLLACLLILSSCSKQVSLDWSQVATFSTPHNLELSSSTFDFRDGQGGTQTLTINSNTSWEITDLPDWLTVDTQKGTGDASVLLTCTANPSFTDVRIAEFAVRPAENDWDYRIPVSVFQVKALPFVSSASSEVTFKYEEEKQTIPVATNVENWTISVLPFMKGEPTDWLTAKKSEDNKAAELSVAINLENRRMAYVVLNAEDTETIITVTQKSPLDLSTTNVSFPFEEGIYETIIVDTDGPFEIINTTDWLTVSDVTEKSFDVTASRNLSGDRTAVINVSTTGQLPVRITRELTVYQENPYNGHAFVDLGLPSGLLWATCNVGADSPGDYGNYYAWGETSTKKEYSWETYVFHKSGESRDNLRFHKYSYDDNKCLLDSEDDAAWVNWGGIWRMPTKEEWDELLDNCNWTWTAQDNHYGYKVTGRVGRNSIFLPAAGIRSDTLLYIVDSFGDYIYGHYWASTIPPATYKDAAWVLSFFSAVRPSMCDISDRYHGMSVRSVCP